VEKLREKKGQRPIRFLLLPITLFVREKEKGGGEGRGKEAGKLQDQKLGMQKTSSAFVSPPQVEKGRRGGEEQTR